MTTTQKTQTPRFSVVGGSGKGQWYLLDDGLRECRIFLLKNDETGETFYAADYRIAGVLMKAQRNQRLVEATTRGEAWREARSTLATLPIPIPPIEEVS